MSKTAERNQVKPDTILKDFWRNNQRFADLFNTVLFEQIFKKPVKSILGRHMWFENNPEITHGKLRGCYKDNKDDWDAT